VRSDAGPFRGGADGAGNGCVSAPALFSEALGFQQKPRSSELKGADSSRLSGSCG
jgi:hypothetical protein